MRAPAPAPDSTTTSTPVRSRRPTTSGTMATRFSPEAVSLGTPNFIGRASVPTDSSVGLFALLLALPVELRPYPERAQDRVCLAQVGGVAPRQRQARGRAYRRRDQEEERDRGDGG